jgi:dipeptidyl-peptidase-4
LYTIKAEEGTELNCRMIKPANFDATKSYPTLVYVYNGPGVQLINNTSLASASLWMHYLANEYGYIIFTVDGRGSENRGRDFEQAMFRNLGEVEMKDQITGVEHLKSLGFVDENRIAVHGWSYGGFMTTNLLCSYPNVFTCGVAGGPVIDWKFYEIMYTERFMDTPQTNPEGYKSASLLNKAKDLQDNLLMIHGTQDDVVVWQHSLAFVQECVSARVQLDYFPYPGHAHNVRGKDRVHLMRKVIDYIVENNK